MFEGIEYRDGLLLRNGREVSWVTLGYKKIRINGVAYSQHRVIWEMHNGPIPDGYTVDHIDNNKLNNRIENLRLATKAEQSYNKGLYKNNKSGVKGVTWHKGASKWRAVVNKNGTYHQLGLFEKLEDAANAVAKKREELHGEFTNHG